MFISLTFFSFEKRKPTFRGFRPRWRRWPRESFVRGSRRRFFVASSMEREIFSPWRRPVFPFWLRVCSGRPCHCHEFHFEKLGRDHLRGGKGQSSEGRGSSSYYEHVLLDQVSLEDLPLSFRLRPHECLNAWPRSAAAIAAPENGDLRRYPFLRRCKKCLGRRERKRERMIGAVKCVKKGERRRLLKGVETHERQMLIQSMTLCSHNFPYMKLTVTRYQLRVPFVLARERERNLKVSFVRGKRRNEKRSGLEERVDSHTHALARARTHARTGISGSLVYLRNLTQWWAHRLSPLLSREEEGRERRASIL